MLEQAHTHSPRVVEMQVIPVAGHDSMLLNLSGAHGPYFTRNVVVLRDSAGNTGLGEVPGGEKIRQTLEDAAALVVGQPIGTHLQVLQRPGDAAGALHHQAGTGSAKPRGAWERCSKSTMS